jgi:CHAT domain-containing protein
MVSLNTQVRAERMRQQTDNARIEELEARPQKVRNTYETFQTSLFAAHPELKVSRGLFPTFEIETAVALIPDSRTAILEYVVTDEQTFLFVLTSGSGAKRRVAIKAYSTKIKRSELSNLVEDFRKLLAVNHPGFRQPGQRLYDLLVKPAEQELEGKATVCIVPDGLLWDLPFQALQNDDDKISS